jgi:coproporphyrinogen III oxidase
MNKEDIADQFKLLQDDICLSLESLDGNGKFHQDLWERVGGGGGRTRVMVSNHIEKGGVNFSAVFGTMPDNICKALEIAPTDFYATGVSIVLHPSNPHVPIIHMNVRYFETANGLWWFGGGIDLTPHYIDQKLAASFHNKLKTVCDKHNPAYYKEFKTWADNYFYIRHRKETRGIGGIFFDRLGKERASKNDLFDFVLDVGKTFIPAYSEQFNENFEKSHSSQEKDWQLHRRGRYAEFNLVWDKGTKFGLHTDGNIESILMSLPPETKWTYNYKIEDREKETLDQLKKGIDWINRTKV